MSERQKIKVNTFISYAHNDQPYFDVFMKSLRNNIKHSIRFEWNIWDDSCIYVGSFWDNEIQQQLKNADLAILLVSDSFLASEYIEGKEFKVFLERYEKENILIAPLMFSPCNYRECPELSKRQFFKPAGRDYGKATIDDFTFADLVKFREVDGMVIPNPNISRYVIDFIMAFEKALEDHLKKTKILKSNQNSHISISPVSSTEETRQTMSQKNTPFSLQSSKYRVVAFDLDGTLLRGDNYKYSWKLVWEYLGLPLELHRKGMQRYLRGELTYEKWCQWVCDYYINKKLKREQFREITSTITLTKKFYETMDILKKEGFTCAIISGGINTFVDEMIMDADSYFKYIFINKFTYSADGYLSGFIPTKYDFQGKADAIDVICEKIGCTRAEVVYVGEGINDEFAINAAGLSIAYPPNAEKAEVLSAISIHEDDLSLILKHIFR